jgi:enhancing lycopene biosynthesis protein 2
MKRRIGVLLTGCGAYDGTDPHEAVLTMLAIQEAGDDPVALALDQPQFHVVDHLTAKEVEASSRNMMAEASRLARGKLYLLQDISPKMLDGLIIPGGQGPAKSLLTGFGTSSPREFLPAAGAFLRDVHQAGAPLGAISLAEFVLSDLLGPWPEGKGCFDLAPTEVLVDEEHLRLLTPGYTLCSGLPELLSGIRALVQAMKALIDQHDS